MLAVTVELSWTAAGLIGAALTAIVTFFVLFDRLRRNLKYYREQQKKDKKVLRGMARLLMLVRHDQGRIMRALEHPIEPSRADDSGVFEGLPETFDLEELILPEEDDEDD